MIRIADLTKIFRTNVSRWSPRHVAVDRKALDGVTFECTEGRACALLGPNGAGKTTLLRIVATILRPTLGTVSVAGFDVRHSAAQARSAIGYLTGETGLSDRLTPMEVVQFYGDLHGVPPARLESRRAELFGAMGAEAFARDRIGTLSTGMRQKISIIRTIIHDPSVLILDEPTSGLDVAAVRHVRELIQDSRERGKTVLFSTHNMAEVRELSDDVVVIDKGSLRFAGTGEKFESMCSNGDYESGYLSLLAEV